MKNKIRIATLKNNSLRVELVSGISFFFNYFTNDWGHNKYLKFMILKSIINK